MKEILSTKDLFESDENEFFASGITLDQVIESEDDFEIDLFLQQINCDAVILEKSTSWCILSSSLFEYRLKVVMEQVDTNFVVILSRITLS